ncbi:hypothetical protein VTO73DRAFT_11706 [Trametes versicolor]
MIPRVTTSSVGGLAGFLTVVAANQNPTTLGISAGRLTIELLTTDDVYARTYDELTTRTIVFSEQANPTLEELDSVKTVVYDPKDTLSDTCLFIPPARNDKAKISHTLLEAAKKAKTVQNLVLLSSAGADSPERDAQSRLREFIDLETLAMQSKGDTSSGDTGHSPRVIHDGFYAEKLLLYSKQAQGNGELPLPILEDHKVAPVALGEVAQITTYVVTSDDPHRLVDSVRGRFIVATGEYWFCAFSVRV